VGMLRWNRLARNRRLLCNRRYRRLLRRRNNRSPGRLLRRRLSRGRSGCAGGLFALELGYPFFELVDPVEKFLNEFLRSGIGRLSVALNRMQEKEDGEKPKPHAV